MILNIETSSKKCSVALCEDGAIWFNLDSQEEMDHSLKLAPFVDRCMEELRARERHLDAVAVSMGPGSYTGLRIGLSLAKGLCFGMNLPLIGVSTLELLAVKGMFGVREFDERRLFVPMIDARRMEVYTAVYDIALKTVLPPTPLILDENSYSEFKDLPLVFIGDAVAKAKEVVGGLKDARWIEAVPNACDMMALSEKALRNGEFIDPAYSTPFYLKNFQATTPKKNIIC